MGTMSWTSVTTRASSRHGVVSYDEVLAAGFSKGQVETMVRCGRLVPIGPSAWRIGGVPDSLEARVLGVLLGLEGDAWASHRTAGRLGGIRVHGPADVIDITRPYGASARRGSVHIHRSTLVPAHHVTTVRGVPVTTVPRTLFDLARRTGPRGLDRMVEEALRDRLCTVGSLHRVLAELGGRGRPGTRKMRAALESRDVDYIPTSSELTAVGRAVVADVPGIEWEVPMSDERGFIRQVDALVRHARVVVEFDGARFHGQPSDVASDAEGDARLTAAGYVVERCTWTALTRRPEATRAVIDRLVGAGTGAA